MGTEELKRVKATLRSTLSEHKGPAKKITALRKTVGHLKLQVLAAEMLEEELREELGEENSR